jgi:ribulose 1,5-bisphosphate synthetase/thiazole synthase
MSISRLQSYFLEVDFLARAVLVVGFSAGVFAAVFVAALGLAVVFLEVALGFAGDLAAGFCLGGNLRFLAGCFVLMNYCFFGSLVNCA